MTANPKDRSEIEDLKSRVDLAAFIRRAGVEFKQMGKNLLGRCPFPDEELVHPMTPPTLPPVTGLCSSKTMAGSHLATTLRHRSGRRPLITTIKACSCPSGMYWVVRCLRVRPCLSEASTSIPVGHLRIGPIFLRKRRQGG